MSEQSERLWALPEDKRARLLDPAQAEFIRHGYTDASLNRVLSDAQMSKGQAYYYITGKSDLYLAVCTRDFSPLLDFAHKQAETLRDVDDYWIGLENLVGDLVDLLHANDKVAALALTVYGSAAAAECLAPLTAQLDAILDDVIQIGQTAEEVRADLPDGLIRDMLKALARSVDRWFALNGPSLSPEEMAHTSNSTFEMIRGLVRPLPEGNSND
ncbi:Bacterial regulatory proteins, tetR family [Pelagimonas phthalicica]|uniref:Bacterial regulatory proteins, tetR family n=1 Tax=Pelagimonas phthalicica TaxID=1037362 RepID=A0A238JC73_9RHOB|nr:TetR/AcrR family transcriptional regulator [Pelagimonas phthalicica]TDS91142.1 TetR family transcriptional regulator [Pelagimonas phthalicica]SMX28189.1 Bacterial regulatory proteins, tetR family [Pelagimonas phthalicica]